MCRYLHKKKPSEERIENPTKNLHWCCCSSIGSSFVHKKRRKKYVYKEGNETPGKEGNNKLTKIKEHFMRTQERSMVIKVVKTDSLEEKNPSSKILVTNADWRELFNRHRSQLLPFSLSKICLIISCHIFSLLWTHINSNT